MFDVVGVPEIQTMLGVSRATAWRYVRRADFPAPAVELGNKRLWKRRDVEQWAGRTLPLAFDPRRKGAGAR